LGFTLQMPDTKFQPTSTMKNKDKSTEQRFDHCERHKSQFSFEYHVIKLVTQ